MWGAGTGVVPSPMAPSNYTRNFTMRAATPCENHLAAPPKEHAVTLSGVQPVPDRFL